MLHRFSLYGFLKNQRYFEPFLILILLEKGLDFFQIGLLIGFQEGCINLMEIPSGAAADLYGRRRAMILSFISYIISFVLFALSHSMILLTTAVFFFAIGEAFRTGTHKAMIFNWLESEGQTKKKTMVYGFTRSWSKIGSALSVLVATGLVFYTGDYASIFWFSIPPYILAIINFLGYPAYLDGQSKVELSLSKIIDHFWASINQAWKRVSIRRLIIESMGFGGLFKINKSYLQPILQQTALTLPILVGLMQIKRSAILIGIVYFILHLLSSVASRQAHRLVALKKSAEHASKFLWQIYLSLFIVLVPGFLLDWDGLIIASFLMMAIVQNFWRPLIVSRFDDHSTSDKGATMLSIESQSKSVGTMLFAPLIGRLVDQFGFLPLAFFGLFISLSIMLRFYRKSYPE